MGVLKEAIAVEKAEVGFDFLFPEPLLVYSLRRGVPEFMEDFSPCAFYRGLMW